MRKSLIVGPSTGWLYAKGVSSLARQQAIIHASGANAVEFHLRDNLDDNNLRVKSLANGEFSDHVLYRSMHLPDHKDNTKDVVQAITAIEIAAKQNVSVLLVHPIKHGRTYPTRYFEMLSSSSIRLAIENMDKRKSSGVKIKDLVRLVESCGLGFVLDLQHAYEHDSTMAYASELLDALLHHIVHVHVSGETDKSIHSLVYKASNARAIIDFLALMFTKIKTPIILEGEYETAEDLKQEILFIKKELGFK